MKHACRTLAAAILVTALTHAASAAVLFSDDFESYSADSLLTTSGPWGTANSQTAPIIVRDEATATPFGTPNQYLDFNDLLDEGAAAVPEPAPVILLGLGGLALVRRRR